MTATKYDYPWALEEALPVVRELQALVEPLGYHMGLMGSVLTKGSSSKDLDLIIYPATTATHTPESIGFVRVALAQAGLQLLVPVEKVQARWTKIRSMYLQDEKHCEIWLYKHRRIDLFFLK